MPMRTLIVDDELLARERLKRLVTNVQEVEIIGEARDGIQALEMIQTLAPDLVLLDIQMPGLDGFAVVEALEAPPLIIFVTAFDEYAIRAFEAQALDYLLKPVSQTRLHKALGRAQASLSAKRDLWQQFAPLFKNLAAQGQYISRLAVRDGDCIRVLDVNEVDWIDVAGEMSRVHVGAQTFLLRRTLKELAVRLDPACFFHAHRSIIVNLERVSKIIPWFKGSHKLELTTGAQIELSRTRGRVLREILGW